MSRRGVALVLAAAWLPVAVAACSVPDKGRFQEVEPGDIPFGLDETTAPTTTSTTVVTPSTVPSTTSSVTTEAVDLYYVSGVRLAPTSTVLVRPASPQQVIEALKDGPGEGTEFVGLRSALPNDTGIVVTVQGGVATVAIPPELLSTITGDDQRFAVAQVVMTLTSRPGIGQVVFTVDGQPQQVPRGGGDLTSAPVTFDDYRNLLAPGG